jgi:hypothetical protein
VIVKVDDEAVFDAVALAEPGEVMGLAIDVAGSHSRMEGASMVWKSTIVLDQNDGRARSLRECTAAFLSNMSCQSLDSLTTTS